MVKNPPSDAGDMGSIPGQGTKIPHAAGPLGPHTTTTELTHLNKTARVPQTTEPACPGAHAPQLERKPAHHNKSSHMPQGRSRMLQLRPDVVKK